MFIDIPTQLKGKKVFLDTNYLCALFNSEDTLYKKAHNLTSILDTVELVISNFILLESYTIISQRVSKDQAIRFRNYIKKENPYELFWINKKLEQNTWEIFKAIKDKNFSYVDASILAVMQKERINYLLSFDGYFKKLEKEYNFKLIGV